MMRTNPLFLFFLMSLGLAWLSACECEKVPPLITRIPADTIPADPFELTKTSITAKGDTSTQTATGKVQLCFSKEVDTTTFDLGQTVIFDGFAQDYYGPIWISLEEVCITGEFLNCGTDSICSFLLIIKGDTLNSVFLKSEDGLIFDGDEDGLPGGDYTKTLTVKYD